MTATAAIRRPLKGAPVRRAAIAVLLVAGWCALWGEVSIANLASGAVIAALLDRTPLGGRPRGRLRLLPLLRFAALVARDAAVSTISVSAEVLTRVDHTAEAIIAVELPAVARHHLLLLVVAVTVTPGTAVVDVDGDTGTLYLHLLHDSRRAATEATVRRLAALAVDAFGADEDVAVRVGGGEA